MSDEHHPAEGAVFAGLMVGSGALGLFFAWRTATTSNHQWLLGSLAVICLLGCVATYGVWLGSWALKRQHLWVEAQRAASAGPAASDPPPKQPPAWGR